MKLKIIPKIVLLTTTIFLILSYAISPFASAQTDFFKNLEFPFFDPGSGSESCSTGSVSPGSGAPDGANFPNLDSSAMADAINTWINQQNPSSKLKGLGSTMVSDGKSANVNPFLIVAIAKEESGLSDPNDFNVKHANNSFGREATPSQPHFQGANLWYKWSSVEASIDNTAPENKNAVGGGDMATYLRDQYGNQLDSNNLVAMFMEYAPPGQNNTQQYIANVQSWIKDLVNLTNGSPAKGNPTDSSCTGATTSCTNSSGTQTGVNAAILCEAEKYAGIYYQSGGGHQGYSTFRQGCPENSISSAAGRSSAASPGPCATDCSGLVSVAVDAVYGQSFGWVVTNNTGVMSANGSSPANEWKSIPINQAQAGDIVTSNDGAGSAAVGTDGHVEIVDHVKGDTVYSFGSHYTGSKTGPSILPSSAWNIGAWRYVGPGSSKS